MVQRGYVKIYISRETLLHFNSKVLQKNKMQESLVEK